ncbi:MAG: hypothetical protein LIP11_11135 [Clostridiales bacterium]|nr:hypothetical protein [Clostridiales bacterium]
MADNSAVRHNDKNEAIQAELNKKAARSDMINRIVPYLGLAFVVVFLKS